MVKGQFGHWAMRQIERGQITRDYQWTQWPSVWLQTYGQKAANVQDNGDKNAFRTSFGGRREIVWRSAWDCRTVVRSYYCGRQKNAWRSAKDVRFKVFTAQEWGNEGIVPYNEKGEAIQLHPLIILNQFGFPFNLRKMHLQQTMIALPCHNLCLIVSSNILFIITLYSFLCDCKYKVFLGIIQIYYDIFGINSKYLMIFLELGNKKRASKRPVDGLLKALKMNFEWFLSILLQFLVAIYGTWA